MDNQAELGKAYALSQQRIKTLEAELAALRSKTFIAQLLDASGSVIQEVQFGHDRPLKLRLVPTK